MTEQINEQHRRVVDRAGREAVANKERFDQSLIDALSGGTNMSVRYIVTPPGGGSPAGLHVHAFEQLFYILDGKMNIEIDGEEFVAGPETLVIFPEAVPHRNWNAGTSETVHLAINSPLPDPNKPFATSVSTSS